MNIQRPFLESGSEVRVAQWSRAPAQHDEQQQKDQGGSTFLLTSRHVSARTAPCGTTVGLGASAPVSDDCLVGRLMTCPAEGRYILIVLRGRDG